MLLSSEVRRKKYKFSLVSYDVSTRRWHNCCCWEKTIFLYCPRSIVVWRGECWVVKGGWKIFSERKSFWELNIFSITSNEDFLFCLHQWGQQKDFFLWSEPEKSHPCVGVMLVWIESINFTTSIIFCGWFIYLLFRFPKSNRWWLKIKLLWWWHDAYERKEIEKKWW